MKLTHQINRYLASLMVYLRFKCLPSRFQQFYHLVMWINLINLIGKKYLHAIELS